MARSRVIIGLDPGTAATGYGVIEQQGNRLGLLSYGVIATSPELELHHRLEIIFTEVAALLQRHRPESAAVESLFFNANARTALAVGQARGVVLLACAQVDCGVFEYTPQQVKQAVVGYGKAEKRQVQQMVKMLLGMTEVPRPDDAADALGVAVCHAHASQQGALMVQKEGHRTGWEYDRLAQEGDIRMIDRLTGLLLSKTGEGAVVEVGGIGFYLEMSTTTLRDLPQPKESVMVFTHLHVREDALQLFGFSSEDERTLFRMLIGVSKIGPRLALAALSARRPADVRQAIALGDAAVFQAVPGIGKRTAERLILELREKVGEIVAGPAMTAVPSGADGNLSLARSALVELGLTPAEAERLLRGADPEQPVEALVRVALGQRS